MLRLRLEAPHARQNQASLFLFSLTRCFHVDDFQVGVVLVTGEAACLRVSRVSHGYFLRTVCSGQGHHLCCKIKKSFLYIRRKTFKRLHLVLHPELPYHPLRPFDDAGTVVVKSSKKATWPIWGFQKSFWRRCGL